MPASKAVIAEGLQSMLDNLVDKYGDTPAARALLVHEFDQAVKRHIKPDWKPGDIVELEIHQPGPCDNNRVTLIDCMVLYANAYESDLIVVPEVFNIENFQAAMEDNGIEDQDVVEGPVYVMRNQNNEHIRLLHIVRP